MRWARVAVAVGVLLVAGAFALGTEVRPTVRIGGTTTDCARAIPAGWLVAGTPNESVRPAACGPREALIRSAFWGALGVGALTLLVGAGGAVRPR